MKKLITVMFLTLTSFSAMAGSKSCIFRTENKVAQQFLTTRGYKVVNGTNYRHFDLIITPSYMNIYEECEDMECMTFGSQSATISLEDIDMITEFESEAGEYDYPIFKLGPPSGPNLKRITLKLLEELYEFLKMRNHNCI